VSVLIAPRDNQILGSFPSDVRSSTSDRADSVVVSPDGTMVFVSNERSGLITRINAQTGGIEQTYNVGDINGNGSTRQLVVTQSPTNPAVYALDGQGRLWKIDGTQDWTITGPPVTLPGTVGQIAVSNDGETVYFSSDDGRQARLRYLDTATMTVKPINTTPIVFLPRFVGPMVVDQETGFLIIDNGAVTAGYTVINPEDGTSPGKGVPIDILDFALNGQDMYVLSPGGSTLQRLPITGGDQVTSSVVVTDGEKVVVAPDGERAYVLTNLNRVTVIEISRDGMRVVGNISIPGGTTDIAISPDGTHLYVTSVNDTVTFISISPGEAPEEPLPPSVL
jgi:DNA-binding beta-propeller fold protein YncE